MELIEGIVFLFHLFTILYVIYLEETKYYFSNILENLILRFEQRNHSKDFKRCLNIVLNINLRNNNDDVLKEMFVKIHKLKVILNSVSFKDAHYKTYTKLLGIYENHLFALNEITNNKKLLDLLTTDLEKIQMFEENIDVLLKAFKTLSEVEPKDKYSLLTSFL